MQEQLQVPAGSEDPPDQDGMCDKSAVRTALKEQPQCEVRELGQETPQCAQNLHTPENLGETQEDQSPKSTNSAQNLHALEA